MEFKINELISLKLEKRITFIYLAGKRFNRFLRLIEINSNDEASDINGKITGTSRNPFPFPFNRDSITPEQEFKKHCSNIQAWVENDYNTRLLHYELSFPLLRSLYELGDQKAKNVYKDKVTERLSFNEFSVVRYLIRAKYLDIFTLEELDVILNNFDFKNLDEKPIRLGDTLIRIYPSLEVLGTYTRMGVLRAKKMFKDKVLEKINSILLPSLMYLFKQQYLATFTTKELNELFVDFDFSIFNSVLPIKKYEPIQKYTPRKYPNLKDLRILAKLGILKANQHYKQIEDELIKELLELSKKAKRMPYYAHFKNQESRELSNYNFKLNQQLINFLEGTDTGYLKYLIKKLGKDILSQLKIDLLEKLGQESYHKLKEEYIEDIIESIQMGESKSINMRICNVIETFSFNVIEYIFDKVGGDSLFKYLTPKTLKRLKSKQLHPNFNIYRIKPDNFIEPVRKFKQPPRKEFPRIIHTYEDRRLPVTQKLFTIDELKDQIKQDNFSALEAFPNRYSKFLKDSEFVDFLKNKIKTANFKIIDNLLHLTKKNIPFFNKPEIKELIKSRLHSLIKKQIQNETVHEFPNYWISKYSSLFGEEEKESLFKTYVPFARLNDIKAFLDKFYIKYLRKLDIQILYNKFLDEHYQSRTLIPSETQSSIDTKMLLKFIILGEFAQLNLEGAKTLLTQQIIKILDNDNNDNPFTDLERNELLSRGCSYLEFLEKEDLKKIYEVYQVPSIPNLAEILWIYRFILSDILNQEEIRALFRSIDFHEYRSINHPSPHIMLMAFYNTGLNSIKEKVKETYISLLKKADSNKQRLILISFSNDLRSSHKIEYSLFDPKDLNDILNKEVLMNYIQCLNNYKAETSDMRRRTRPNPWGGFIQQLYQFGEFLGKKFILKVKEVVNLIGLEQIPNLNNERCRLQEFFKWERE